MPQDRFEKIAAAFREAGGEALSPVRDLLGVEFSYEEIRVARVRIRYDTALAR